MARLTAGTSLFRSNSARDFPGPGAKLQDNKMTVPQSLKAPAERFELSEQQVQQIEQEGLDGDWPPLS